MWKPGTAKPETPRNQHQNAGSQSKKTSSAKKLSSATMGMRFMQRKADAPALPKKQEGGRKSYAQASPKSKNDASNDSVDQSNNILNHHERKRDRGAMSSELSASVTILEVATVVDMYGVGADVVGRRSFGGYHKAMKTTWDAAVKIRMDDDRRTKATKSHVTDEELLQRYEKYVRGRGGESSSSNGRKEKRKRS